MTMKECHVDQLNFDNLDNSIQMVQAAQDDHTKDS